MKSCMCFALLFTLTCQRTVSQTPKFVYVGQEGEQINEKQVKLWPAASLDEYVGVYNFGESEGEWIMLVLKVDSHLIFQAYSGFWGKTDRDKDAWVRKAENLKSAPVQKGRFAAGKLKGFFATYTDDKVYKGMVLTGEVGNAVASADTAEFGYKSKGPFKDHFYYGEYPQLTYQLMEDAWFKSKTKDELQLMRNEIFARYGMRFNKGGKMYVHFIKEDWYQPRLDNVTALLNEIEKRNLEKIRQYEKE